MDSESSLEEVARPSGAFIATLSQMRKRDTGHFAFGVLVLLLLPSLASARSAETEIKAVLDTQVSAWNRGDLATFVTTYSDNCIFVAKPVRQGRAELFARYRKSYPTLEAMGHLTFTSLMVHLLKKDVALVTAEWHLDRTAAAGGSVGGYFSLVFERRHGLWKIALDHTTALP